MKKVFKKIMALCLILLCITSVSCNSHSTSNGRVSQTTDRELPFEPTGTNNSIENQSSTELTSDINSIQPGEVPLFGLYSEDEYKKHMENTAMPDWFISYDQLSFLGRFKGVVFLENAIDFLNDPANELKYYSYMYSFEGLDQTVTLYIYHPGADNAPTDDKRPVVSTKDNGDLRSLSDKASGVYFQGNVRYSYIQGVLLSIEWKASDVTYVLHASDMLGKYSSGSAFINSMMNKNEVESALSYFDKQVNSSKNENNSSS